VVILVDDAEGAPNHIDPVEGPIPEGAVPSPAEITASELMSWLDTHPDASAGGVSVDASGQTVTVAWKGTVPQAVRDLAASQPAPVEFVNAAFSAAELTAEAERIANAYPQLVAGVGPRDDYSGLTVELIPSAGSTAQATAQIVSSVPFTIIGTADPVPASRNADSAPFWEAR
jgi:hypothetical protein